MNDMRLPGVVPFSAEIPAGPGAESARDPAQAFDAVMSRYANDRQRPNTPAPPERSRDTKNTQGAQADRGTPANNAAPAGRTNGDNAPEQNTPSDDTQAARGKPAARSKPAADDEDGDSAASSAASVLDPATLAVLAASALQGRAPVATQAAAGDALTDGTKDVAGKQAKDGATANARSVIDVLAGRIDVAAGRGAARPLHAEATTEDGTEATPGTTPRRGALGPKDTLRIDAPLTRAIDAVQAEVVQRVAAGTSTFTRSPATAAPVLQVDAASPALTATLAATNAAGSTAGTYSIVHAAVSAPVGSAAFSDELAQRVVMFAGQKLQRADIAVTPADLGPIAVSIEVRGQEATLAFTAASHTTRAAIEDALPRLREMLSAQGLQLAGAHVGSEPRRDAYRPARDDTGRGNSRRTDDGVASVAATDVTVARRRVSLIDIEV